MANQSLIIGWDKQTVVALAGTAATGIVRVGAHALFDWPEQTMPTQTPVQAGQWLRKQLDAAGIRETEAVISLPREDAVLRHLELPDVPDDELPEIVRLQAATKSSLPPDQMLIDFLPLPSVHNSQQRRVLVATIPKSLAETLRKTLTAAGLELTGIGLGSLGVAELGCRSATPAYGRALLVLNLGYNRLELDLVQDGQLLTTNSAYFDADRLSPAVIQAEINRTLVATQQKLGEVSIGALVAFCGPEQQPYLAALRERYGETLHVIDPLNSTLLQATPAIASTEHASLWTGPIGLLLNRSAGRLAGIDFLNPRKPVVKRDNRLLRYAAIGGGVAVAIALGLFGFYSHLSNLDEELADLKRQHQDLTNELKAAAPMLTAKQELDAWLARDLHLVAELDRFQQTLPGTGLTILNQFQLDAANPNPKNPPQYTASGFAVDRRSVEEAQAEFAARGFKVPPITLKQNRLDEAYPTAFTLVMEQPAPIAGQAAKTTPQTPIR